MNDFFVRMIALVIKELWAVMRDLRSRMSVIMPPILQICIFGYAATMDIQEVPYAVWDLDHSSWSREYIAALEGNGIFRRMANVESNREMNKLIEQKDIVMGVVIPQGFAKDMASGRPGVVQVIADGRNSNTAGIALGYVQDISRTFSLRPHAGQINLAGQGILIESRAWFNVNMITRIFMVPCLLAVLALLDTVLSASLSIAREKEEGTFDQLMVAPYRPYEIILGKSLSIMIISCFQSCCVLLVVLYWFHIPCRGSLFLLAGVLMVFVMTATGIGLCISTYAKTLQQAMVGTFLVVVPMVMLSGFATPIECMPEIFQDMTLVNPMRYGMSVVQRIFLEGASLLDLQHELIVILAMALGSMLLSLVIFRRRLET